MKVNPKLKAYAGGILYLGALCAGYWVVREMATQPVGAALMPDNVVLAPTYQAKAKEEVNQPQHQYTAPLGGERVLKERDVKGEEVNGAVYRPGKDVYVDPTPEKTATSENKASNVPQKQNVTAE
jgi:hypothetical protein